MSKGSKIVQVRIEQGMLSEIELAMASRNVFSSDEPDTISSWIRRAIQEKLDHLSRSANRRKLRDFSCQTCGTMIRPTKGESGAELHAAYSSKLCVNCYKNIVA